MKTIRVKDQSTQTTPSLTSRPPFRRTIEHSTPMETPEQIKDHRQDDTLPKSSNLILEASKTPLNFDESSSPRFKLSVDETPKDYSPKSRIKQFSRDPFEHNSRKKLKLSQFESPDLQVNHHNNHEQSSERQTMKHVTNKVAVIDNSKGDSSSDPADVEPELKFAKKRGRPKKTEESNKKIVKKAATIPAQKMAKNEQKMTRTDTMAIRKSGAKQDETPVTTKKSSISVTRMEVSPAEEERTEPSPKTLRSPRSPRTKREKLSKKRENLMKKIEIVELKLEECNNPNPNLRRSMRIREKMIRNYHNEISVLMNLVHFVESQDEILMRQQRRYKEKNESTIRRPVGRRAKQLRIVSDEDSNSS